MNDLAVLCNTQLFSVLTSLLMKETAATSHDGAKEWRWASGRR